MPVLIRLVAVDGSKLSVLLVKGGVKVRAVEIVVLEKGGSLAVITVVGEESPSLDVFDKVVAVALLLVVPLIVVPEEELAVVLVVEVGLAGVNPLVVEGVLVEIRLEADVFVVLVSALVRLMAGVVMLLPDEKGVVASVLFVSLEIVEDDGVEKFEDNVEEGESEKDDDVEEKVDNVEEGEFENNDEVEDRVEVDVNEEESKGNDVVEERVEGNADEVVSENEDVEEEVTDDVVEGESGDDDEVEEIVEEVDVGEVEGLVDVKVVSDVV